MKGRVNYGPHYIFSLITTAIFAALFDKAIHVIYLPRMIAHIHKLQRTIGQIMSKDVIKHYDLFRTLSISSD